MLGDLAQDKLAWGSSELLTRPWEHNHALVVRDAAPLYRLEHVVDHAFIAIDHGTNIDFGDCLVRLIEPRASLKMILEWLAQSGSVGD
jgi:hypothetical protein